MNDKAEVSLDKAEAGSCRTAKLPFLWSGYWCKNFPGLRRCGFRRACIIASASWDTSTARRLSHA